VQKYNTGEWVRVEAARHFDRKKRLERGWLYARLEFPSIY
jgi:hypothetical protein